MADTYTKIPAGTPCIWGISDTVTYGTITSDQKAKTGQFADFKNQQGATTGKVHYDTSESRTLEVVVKDTTVTDPEPGTVISVGSTTYMVETCTRTASNEDMVKLSITAVRGAYFNPGGSSDS